MDMHDAVLCQALTPRAVRFSSTHSLTHSSFLLFITGQAPQNLVERRTESDWRAARLRCLFECGIGRMRKRITTIFGTIGGAGE